MMKTNSALVIHTKNSKLTSSHQGQFEKAQDSSFKW